MKALKQFLVLHQDSMFDRIVRGVKTGLEARARAGATDGVRSSEVQGFMSDCLQSPLSGDGYDVYFWKHISDRVQDAYDGVVLMSGCSLERRLHASELIEYALLVLRQRLQLRVLTGRQRVYCMLYPHSQAPHEDDVIPTEIFGFSADIQREVDILHP